MRPCEWVQIDQQSRPQSTTAPQEAGLVNRTMSRHERRLLQCVRELAVFSAAKSKITDVDAFWVGFRVWAIANKTLLTEHADEFVPLQVDTKSWSAFKASVVN